MDMRVRATGAGRATAAYHPETGRLDCRFEGVIGADELRKANEALFEAAGDRPVRSVLIDARESTGEYAFSEMIASTEAFLERLEPRRCAMVSRTDRSRHVMLLETVAFPFAVKVRGFADYEAAAAWLDEA